MANEREGWLPLINLDKYGRARAVEAEPLRAYLAALTSEQRAAVGVFSQGEVESKSLYGPLHTAAIQLWDALAWSQKQMETRDGQLEYMQGYNRETQGRLARLRSELTAAREASGYVHQELTSWANEYLSPGRGMGQNIRMYPNITPSAAKELRRLAALAAPPPKSNEGEPSEAMLDAMTGTPGDAAICSWCNGDGGWCPKCRTAWPDDGHSATRPRPAPTGELTDSVIERARTVPTTKTEGRVSVRVTPQSPLAVYVPTDSRIAQPAAAQGERKCSRCYGSGKTYGGIETDECTRCLGSGKEPPAKAAAQGEPWGCPVCGWRRIDGHSIHCPVLNGPQSELPPAKDAAQGERHQWGEGDRLTDDVYCLKCGALLNPYYPSACKGPVDPGRPPAKGWGEAGEENLLSWAELCRAHVALQSTLAERDREVERLKRQCKDWEKLAHDMGHQAERTIEQRDQAYRQIEEALDAARRACARASTAEQRVRGLEERCAKEEDWRTRAESLREDAWKERSEALVDNGFLRGRAEKAEAERDELSQQYAEATARWAAMNGSLEAELAELKQEIEYQRSRVADRDKELTECDRHTADLASERQQRADREAGVQEMRAGYEQRIAAMQAEADELRARVEAAGKLARNWQRVAAVASSSARDAGFDTGLLYCTGQLNAVLLDDVNPSEPGKVEPK